MPKKNFLMIDRRCWCACFLLAASLCVMRAQQPVFAGKCPLPEIARSGYYHVILPPGAVDASRNCLYDVRLHNEQKAENTPYLLRSELDTLLNAAGDTVSALFAEVALCEYARLDSSDRRTYFTFPRCAKGSVVNRLQFDIPSARPHLRETRIHWDWHTSLCERDFSYCALSSAAGNIIDELYVRMDSSLVVVIDNHDDLPLPVSRLRAFARRRLLTAYLEKGARYTLYCGSPGLSYPQYDLVHFEKDIPVRLPSLDLSSWENIPPPPEQVTVAPPPVVPEARFIETPLFLLIVIVAVGGLLAWVCWSAVRDMKKRSKG